MSYGAFLYSCSLYFVQPQEFINKGVGTPGVVRHVVVVAMSDSVSDEALNLSPDHPDSWSTLPNYLAKVKNYTPVVFVFLPKAD